MLSPISEDTCNPRVTVWLEPGRLVRKRTPTAAPVVQVGAVGRYLRWLVLRIGLALPAYDTDGSASTTLARLAEYAIQAEQLGYDSVWLMDHFWVEREHGREAGHDPLVALAYIATHPARHTGRV